MVMREMDAGTDRGGTWSETVQNTLLRIAELSLRLGSAYLAVCCGIPIERIELIKEMNP